VPEMDHCRHPEKARCNISSSEPKLKLTCNRNKAYSCVCKGESYFASGSIVVNLDCFVKIHESGKTKKQLF
jgi:hypothetical protein